MPFLYLSPSTQEYNLYRTAGTEEYWMNRLADEMLPWLSACGVNTARGSPEGSAAKSIAESNLGEYDFHLALHSNAAPEALAGKLRGVDLYYHPSSDLGLRMALLLADNLATVYPDPALVRARPTTALGEVRRTRAPSVLCELGYHDSPADESWLTGGLGEIAATIVKAVAEYFGVPFLKPGGEQAARVRLSFGSLNLRELPDTGAPVLRQLRDGEAVALLGRYDDWRTVRCPDGLLGFALARYLEIS
jgi:N-acetylmuramoyl-L-alanine amidase